MNNYQNILEILECKNDEPYIKNAQKLIKNIYQGHNNTENEELINEIKYEIRELTNSKLFRIKNLYSNNKLDEEKLDFMIKLINNNEKIYTDIENIKNERKKRDNLENLKELKINTIESKNKITSALEVLFISNITKKISKIPLISRIQKRIFAKKQENEIQGKIEELKKLIEETRTKKENKNLKEEYYKNLNQLLEQIETSCDEKNYPYIKKAKPLIEKEYDRIINSLMKDIEIKSQESIKHICDERLIEYVYNKKNNYVSYAIDHLSRHKNTLVYYAIIILNQIIKIEKKQNIECNKKIELLLDEITNEEPHINKIIKKKHLKKSAFFVII